MTEKQFSETNGSLEPLSLCQALRRVTETAPFISDFGIWRLGLFKRKNAIQLAMLSLAANGGLVIPLFPTLRNDSLLELFYRDEESNSSIFRFDVKAHTVEVFPGDYYNRTIQKNLPDELRDKPPNFKLISGAFFHQKVQPGIFVLDPAFHDVSSRKLFLFNAHLEPQEIEWDIKIDEEDGQLRLQYVRFKKYPRFDKNSAVLKFWLSAASRAVQSASELVIQLGLNPSKIYVADAWLKNRASSLSEIAKKHMNP